MTETAEFIDKLYSCPPGRPGWKQFEDTCVDILSYLFVPPLTKPKIQARTYSGIDRRDAVFPNRNFNSDNVWGYLLRELEARLLLFEFKNYDALEIGKEEVDQTRNYMTKPMGRLAFMCCNKPPHANAYLRRNDIYHAEQKVIVFLTNDHLKQLLFIKERGDDPGDLIFDMYESFYLQHG